MWYREHIGGGRCRWWTPGGRPRPGMILITPLPGPDHAQAGLGHPAVPGIESAVVDEQGNAVAAGGGGYLVLRKPWPAMLRDDYGDAERYREDVLVAFPGMYFTGDGARRDEDGYFWLLGRVDDVMNVVRAPVSAPWRSRARWSTTRRWPRRRSSGSDAEIKGQAIAAFVTLQGRPGGRRRRCWRRAQRARGQEDRRDRQAGRRSCSPPSCPRPARGKIMRRLLRDVAEKRPWATPRRWPTRPWSRRSRNAQPKTPPRRSRRRPRARPPRTSCCAGPRRSSGIARTGLGFTQSLYEQERFEEVLKVAADIRAAVDRRARGRGARSTSG